MSVLAEPMTPVDCDLQDFPFMPLHVARLRDSDLASEEEPEACWYALLLWAASWHQIPAASLPDNDAVLTRLIGLGRDVKTFRKHKAGALRGFVRCSDGRLYHPVVAEQARTAWESKLQQRWRTECARIKKQNQRTGADQPLPTFEEYLRGTHHSGPADVPRDIEACPQGQEAASPGTGTQCPSGNVIQETGTGTGILVVEANASVASAPPSATKPLAGQPWEADPDFGKLWEISTPEMRRRAKSKSKAWAEWRKAKLKAEPASIVAALVAYLASDPDVKRTGGPGLHIWLKDRTFELWAATATGELGADWDEDRWEIAINLWADQGRWDARLGPEPGCPGCRAPSHLVPSASQVTTQFEGIAA